MRILHHYRSVTAELRGAVVAIGNFDGVHRGHQEVIGKAGAIAAESGAPLAILTFEPHPRSFFRPDDPPFRLTTMRNKAHHIAALGVDGLIILTFDGTLAEMSAEAFLEDVLIAGLGVAHVVVGYDFCFGKGRKGTPEMMIERGAFGVTRLEPSATHDGVIYSSTRIRDYLRRGNPGQAAALLGRPFEIEARVVRGDRRGRTIGFPTANLTLGDYLRPAYGVYAVRAGVEERDHVDWYDAVANFGKRPTVDGLTEMFEAHLFDFAGDLYGKYLRVALIEFLRDEKKFAGLDELQAQIAKDSETARRILRTRAAGG